MGRGLGLRGEVAQSARPSAWSGRGFCVAGETATSTRESLKESSPRFWHDGCTGKGMPRDHRNLTAFSLADDLALKVYGLTTRFEPTEHYGLRLQIRRAAVSVPTNIVEGAARESQTEFLRFLEIAFGSSREVVYLADLSRRLGFLEAAGAHQLTTDGNRVAATLGALRLALRRS